jgi:hypothetical protein
VTELKGPHVTYGTHRRATGHGPSGDMPYKSIRRPVRRFWEPGPPDGGLNLLMRVLLRCDPSVTPPLGYLLAILRDQLHTTPREGEIEQGQGPEDIGLKESHRDAQRELDAL